MRTSNQAYLCCGLFLIILALPLFAFAMSERAVSIEVSVRDEHDAPYEECRLELLSADHQRLDYSPIFPEFAVAFALAPRPRLYLLRIACMGSDETFTSEPKLLGDIRTSLRVPVELGIVRLKRRGSSGRSKQ